MKRHLTNLILIVKLSKQDQLNNHVPDDIFRLSHEYDVFYRDHETGELVQIVDLTDQLLDQITAD